MADFGADRALVASDQARAGLGPAGFDHGYKLKVLSLFAGIGGFDLGLERTGGFRTVAFCEFDKKAQRVLAKHWPGVPIYDDVRTLTGGQLAADGIAVDVIVGGFPCQDISTAGAGAGIEGERSGLWADYARLIGELRPAFVIVENVSALLSRGLGRVLGDLAALGYDAEWHCIPASAVGAPHRRDRIWIIAHPQGDRRQERGTGHQGRNDNSASIKQLRAQPCGDGASDGAQPMANPTRIISDGGNLCEPHCPRQMEQPARGGGGNVADAKSIRRQQGNANPRGGCPGGGKEQRPRPTSGSWWSAEPCVGRVADGVPNRVDRLKQLGNAVVPQIPELIGNAILSSLAEQRRAA